MKNIFYSVALSILFCSISGSAIYPNELVVKQKNFILKLYKDKNYFNTIEETRRLISFPANLHFIEDYKFFIQANYFHGEQYKSVILNYNSNSVSKLQFRDYTILSQSYLKLGMYDLSYHTLKNYKYSYVSEKDRISLLLKKIEPLYYLNRYKQAVNEIKSAEPFFKKNPLYENIYNEVTFHYDAGFKSLALASTMSALFPGAGQVYSGRYIDGLLSFLGVAVMAGATVFCYKKNEKSLSYMFGFFTIVFYGGNVYSAYNSVNWANANRSSQYLKDLRKYIPEYNPVNDVDLKRMFN